MVDAWERAVEAALESQAASPRTLTLDGSVKCLHGQLPPPHLLERFPSLEHLSIANTGVSSLDHFPKLRRLRRLILSDNRISSGLGSLHHLDSLRDLDLSNNRIAALADLSPLSSLRLVSLDLYECPVTKIQNYREKVFEMIPSLKYLDKMDKEGNERLESDEDDEEDDDEEEEEENGHENGFRLAARDDEVEEEDDEDYEGDEDLGEEIDEDEVEVDSSDEEDGKNVNEVDEDEENVNEVDEDEEDVEDETGVETRSSERLLVSGGGEGEIDGHEHGEEDDDDENGGEIGEAEEQVEEDEWREEEEDLDSEEDGEGEEDEVDSRLFVIANYLFVIGLFGICSVCS